jgi:signal recognition particle GTPase
MCDESLALPEMSAKQLLDAFMTVDESQLDEIVDELRRRTLAAGSGVDLFEFIYQEGLKTLRF